MRRSGISRRSFLLAISVVSAVLHGSVFAQTASISEERRFISTYEYSEANPVPVLVSDPRLYPYHKYQAYAVDPVEKEWTVVKLENAYIEVYVLPEVGGKVWGAIEKSSGHEFIYRNEVLKFRSISLRGPWTSGGIEFNFGVIGHTPATASPVDYKLVENPDGSVSCFVGAMDLPSRTHWRVEIRLPADKSIFETNVFWTNPTPLTQSYYNWMTAAAFARVDLELSIPGNQYLRHGGEALSWPVDDTGRLLSSYSNNAFGGSKSYHVVGEFNDFFGGYYTDDDYGFGHWSRYSEMPGQKLWLWALSRQGGIWEDLLTDTDGQYIEFQAGRLFVQYSPGSHVNPITQAGFEPYVTDTWKEIWFPVEGIGGLSDVSPKGVMSVREKGGELTIGINVFQESSATISVITDGETIHSVPFSAEPLQAISKHFAILPEQEYEIVVPELDLHFRSSPGSIQLSRPFETEPAAKPSIPEADRDAFEGWELLKARRYSAAMALFQSALSKEPWHSDALLGVSELYYRRGEYAEGLVAANRLLQLDSYSADANFQAGIHYRALSEFVNAKEAFGWAERSMTHRSAANAELAELALNVDDYNEAVFYARKALDYDRNSINAHQVLAIAGRSLNDVELVGKSLAHLLKLDPLNHFVQMERHLADVSSSSPDDWNDLIRSEFPDQVFLELAISYKSRGRGADALQVLELADSQAPSQVGRLWAAFLTRTPDPESSSQWLVRAADVEPIGRPYRQESIPVMEWVVDQSDDWLWTYLLGLNYWAVGRKADAAAKLKALGARPDDASFYVARAALLREVEDHDEEVDLHRALMLDGFKPAIRLPLVQYLQRHDRWEEALELTKQFRETYVGQFNMDVLHARSLVHLNRPIDAINVLQLSVILPSEGSREGHTVYEEAHLMAGLDELEEENCVGALSFFETGLEWPENLGAGRSYDPDDRIFQFLIGTCNRKVGNDSEARTAFRRVIAATESRIGSSQLEHYLGFLAHQKLGNESGARELIQVLSESAHSNQASTQWVLARAGHNLDPVRDLEAGEMGISDSFSTRMFRRVADLIEQH